VKRIAPLLLAGLAATALAGFDVKSRFSEAWASHTFKIQAASDLTRLWFTIPARMAITVAAKADSVDIAPVRLRMNNSLDLKGAGTFTVTVAYDSGQGGWSCRDVAGNPTLLEFQSYVGVNAPARLTFDTEDDVAKWKFGYPTESTVLVRRIGQGGKVVEEQDLADDPSFAVYGSGSYTLEVAATEGGGKFTATRIE